MGDWTPNQRATQNRGTSEPDDAAAADRYAFMHPGETTNLYLRPGIYRLRAWDINGKTLSKHSITVAQP
ncbi:hypothetical protein CS053_00120 [Rhodanobacter glycinis]|uniref:Uncharacterized protein n=1 Tax=Rhodanobacter glycinis TaxID=582702 RepID=A0A5B9DWS9_9GAMM|nr:hypothetical protein CS053_00120 [Rhodanobacter glycinis]